MTGQGGVECLYLGNNRGNMFSCYGGMSNIHARLINFLGCFITIGNVIIKLIIIIIIITYIMVIRANPDAGTAPVLRRYYAGTAPVLRR